MNNGTKLTLLAVGAAVGLSIPANRMADNYFPSGESSIEIPFGEFRNVDSLCLNLKESEK